MIVWSVGSLELHDPTVNSCNFGVLEEGQDGDVNLDQDFLYKFFAPLNMDISWVIYKTLWGVMRILENSGNHSIILDPNHSMTRLLVNLFVIYTWGTHLKFDDGDTYIYNMDTYFIHTAGSKYLYFVVIEGWTFADIRSPSKLLDSSPKPRALPQLHKRRESARCCISMPSESTFVGNHWRDHLF